MKKLILLLFIAVILSPFYNIYGDNIIPIRTDVSGFGTWIDVDIAGTTYLQLLKSTSTTTSPAMNFNNYTSQTLDFKARTFGGTNTSANTVTVYISTDNGSNWTSIGTRLPASSTLTAMTQFSLSAYAGIQVKIKFASLGGTNSIGFGIDDITIAGTPAAGLPTIITTTPIPLTYSTASSGGTGITNGGGTVSAKGICYGTTANPDISVNFIHTSDGNGISDFTSNISGLNDNTLYHVRAYATNENGTGYGSDLSFTTLVIGAPTANDATSVSYNGFTANWSSVTGASGYYLDVSTNSSFTTSVISENFTGFTTNNGTVDRSSSLDTYLQTTGWTGAQIYEMPGYTKLGSGSNQGIITTKTLDLSGNGGNSTLNFDLQLFGTDANKLIQVFHAPDGTTFAQVGSDITSPATMTTQTVSITGGTINSKIRIQAKGTSNNRFYLDNISVCFDYRLSAYNNKSVSGTSQAVSGLSPNTTYYYRVRSAGVNSTSSNSNSKTAVTLIFTGAPSLLTTTPTPLTYSTASSGGTSISNGGGTVSAKGVCYGTISNPDISGSFSHTLDGSGTGDFTSNISGLTDNTTYHVRAYATNEYGTGYGSDLSFITLNISAPTANDATSVSSNGFTANWSSVPGASGGYKLDVILNHPAISENFTGFTTNNGTTDRSGSLNSYLQASGWTGQAIYEMTGYTKLGTASAQGIITTPTIDLSGNSGNWTLNFDLQLYGTDANKLIQVFLAPDGTTFAQVGLDITAPATMTTQTVSITGGTVNSKIRIQAKNSNSNRFYLDNINVSYGTLLPSYNNLSVSGTSQPVTGLTASTSYFYQVRAVGGNSTSSNSGTKTVLTYNDQSTANFRTITGTSNGNFGDPGSWEYNLTGSSYSNATNSPNANNNCTVQASTSLIMNSDFTINSGKIVTVNGSLDCGTYSISGNGNFTLGASGTLTTSNSGGLDVSIAVLGTKTFTAGSTIVFNASGSQTLSAMAYSKLTLSGTGTKTLGGDITVSGALTINPGVILDANSRTVTITGAGLAWNNTGSFTYGTSKIVMNGSAAQSMHGSTFYDLEINNPLGVTLETSDIVTHQLILTSGKVTLGANDLTVSGTIIGASASKYIITNGTGTLVQNVGGTSVAFPIGLGSSDYTPIEFSTGAARDFGVRVILVPTPNVSTGGLGRQWVVKEATYLENTVFNSMALTWNGNLDVVKTLVIPGFCDVVANINGSVDSYDLLKKGLTVTGNSLATFNPAPSGPILDITTGLYITVVNNNSLLPVELSTFTPNVNGRVISLNWTTKTEKNSNKFDIERSVLNGNSNQTWTNIGSVKAADLSNSPKHYSFTDKNLQVGKYQYRLKMIDNDGSFQYSKLVETEVTLPRDFDLSQNYPNPFNPSTKINYSLPNDSRVTLDIYNILGVKVGQLVNQDQSGGYYSIEFSTSTMSKSLTSGVYLYRLTAVDKATGNSFSSIKKMMMLK